ncbi:MAG: hypothetical protein NAOJABEB_00652 [Steroidobacteraceae bacterium]|nr:hypothetical protein [Steroidobacteraceae bacterium]
MRILVAMLCLLPVSGSLAADPAASEASVRTLMEVTRARQLMDGAMAQLDAVMQGSMKQAMGSATFTAQQQAVLDEMRSRIVGLLTREMSWEKLEPDLIGLYQKTFTEEEVAGMLDFYRTKAGQAVITKMPVIMQYSLQLIQERMGAVAPELQRIQRESLEQMKACCASEE